MEGDELGPDLEYSEDDTLLGGESGDEFDFGIWEKRLSAGKYNGWKMLMQAALHQSCIDENTRRWKVTFRGFDYTEDGVLADVAEFAERYANQGWGFITATINDNVRAVIGPARAVLYGICRGHLNMDHKAAVRATSMPAKEIMGCFEWYEVESVGKAEEPA